MSPNVKVPGLVVCAQLILSKTCYFVNSNHLTLRTVKGQWMVPGKPEKLPDRYVWYFGRKAKYSLTSNKRNALAVLQA